MRHVEIAPSPSSKLILVVLWLSRKGGGTDEAGIHRFVLALIEEEDAQNLQVLF